MALSGDVKALIQANNGTVLAGTNNSARIYKSLDNGQNWTQVIALGSSTDSVNAFAKVSSTGYLLAAVSGGATAQGIWRSLDHGATWTKVKSHPSGAGNGYYDITAIQGGSNLVAVGAGTAFPYSPIVITHDQGVTWSDVSISYYNQPFTGVSAYQEGILSTQYPGESYGAVFAFYGSDTFYTQLGGTGYAGTAYGFSTVGGGAGNGALDMLSFLIKDGQGNYRRKALWAVKSAANTANTEIWAWPSSPTGPYSFAKIATISSENFRGLYVDPTPDATNLQRTIWAGGAGTIYVSYNSGLTWAAATAAPTGQIYSFVRTTSGVLIAGGASGEIFLFSGTGSEGGGGDTGGGGTTTPPTAGLATTRILGQEATCENEVYVSNKSSFSNVTHVFHYNGSTYTTLQFASDPPYELLGSSAAVNKAAYFGSKTNDTNVPGGPFSSLIFNISQISKNITIVWEYWNGSTWATLTTQDNTDQFKNDGVNSVSWTIPTAWATTTVNSIVGYFVRARISAVSGSSQTPIQATRFIYTGLLPYVEIDEDQVKGDLPALARIRWTNQASFGIERTICGLRSISRGSNYNAFINISDTQLPFGVSISKGSEAGVAWQTDKEAPAGRSLIASYSSAGDLNDWNDLAVVTFSTSVAREYYGYFRAFLRVFYNNALGSAWNLRLQLRVGSGGAKFTTDAVYPLTLCQYEVLDFKQLTIGSRRTSSMNGSLSDQLQIAIQGYCTSTSKPLTLYDLILIPTDEWALDAIVPEIVTVASPQVATHNFLDIDSIGNPKVAIHVTNRNSNGLIVSQFQAINNGPVILQKSVTQRFWFLNMTYENFWKGNPEILGSVQVDKQQQYLGFRGRN
jgi:hypothetical protein